MRKIKSLMPIILLSIFLIAGMASAASLTPVGTCVTGSPQLIDIALTVDDGRGIINFDVTITGTGLTTTEGTAPYITGDVIRGTIPASWMTFQASQNQTGTGGVKIIGAGGTGSDTAGPGTLATIRFTATDGTVDTETVAVTVTDVTPGITLTPVAYTPVNCGTPIIPCLIWTDVTDKYDLYTTPGSGVSWADVIGCYIQYITPPAP
jgi:hypothetical protein